MARKSRKVDLVNVSKNELAAQWTAFEARQFFKAGLYARLSFESELNRERNTIETQMILLHSFVEDQKDIAFEKEYVDISKTGTNFERQGFEEMMQDIKNGVINCVIVKDLSRLGRNYVEAGSYVERVFPFFDVRFISVNDHFDSLQDEPDLLISMSNIYNEYYSKDLAKKVKSAYMTSYYNGEFLAGSVPYGYIKDPNDHKHIIVDEETAPIVKNIFSWFLSGTTYADIVRNLNEQNILPPRTIKKQRMGKDLGPDEFCRWRISGVRKIIDNGHYTGNSIHLKNKHDTWAEKKQTANPREKWIIIENTHEPIISMADFQAAQKLVAARSDHYNNNPNKGKYSIQHFNFFKGRIKCAFCGKTMYLYGDPKGKMRFDCGSYKLRKSCVSHSISSEEVNDQVLRVIRTHMNLYIDNVEMIRRLNQRQENIKKYDVFQREIRKTRKKLAEIAKHRQRLFEDYVSKLIDAQQYEVFSNNDSQEEQEVKEYLEKLLEKKAGYSRDFHTDEEWEEKINRFRNTRSLTKEMVEAFIESIEVGEGNNINIHMAYEDDLKKLISYAREREVETC